MAKKRNPHYVGALRSVRKTTGKELASLRKKKARAKAGTPEHALLTGAINSMKAVDKKVSDCCQFGPGGGN
jgi:hypothetical protein